LPLASNDRGFFIAHAIARQDAGAPLAGGDLRDEHPEE